MNSRLPIAFRPSSARAGIAAALALTAAVITPAAAAPPVPIEPYGRLPTIEMVALSMDGGKLATVQSVGDDRVLAVTSLEDGKILGGIHLQDIKMRGLRWADDRHVLVIWASTNVPIEFNGPKVELELIQSYDVVTRELTPLLKHIATYLATADTFYERPIVVQGDKGAAVVLHTQLGATSGLVRVDLNTGAETVAKQGDPHTYHWLVNDHGEPVAEEAYKNDTRRWTINLLAGGRTVQSISGVAPLDSPSLLGLSADGGAAVVAMPEGEAVRLRQLSFKDGAWGADLTQDASGGELIRDVTGERMIGLVTDGNQPRYRFLDPDVQKRWEWVERTFWKQRAQYLGSSADHTRFVVQTFGPKAGFAYYLADSNEHITRLIGKIYPDVTQIAEVRSIHYPAADGLDIPAFLTLPPGRAEKDLPVVILPHGGPQGHDEFGFDWWAQGLASQGYAVLQPQFRGSDLNRGWLEKGYGEWGRKMQSDVADGLRYLAKEGIVDPKRACIVGASYGGYVALAGATLEAGTYRCAISVAGVSDPAGMMRFVRKWSGSGDLGVLRYLDRFMGATDTGDRRLDEIAPIKHVDRVDAPVLLIHGKEDSVVPFEQSTEMEKALKKAGKNVEFVALAKEDHHMSRSETRLQMLRSQIDFLRRYNPPD
jgi:dipeptidyl aminopeptidase/acylaminoacyl peptidase